MPPDPLPVGYVLGPYRIDAALHQGTAGRFYKAVNTSTQATVAINVLDAGGRNPEVALRLLRAAQDLAKADDPRLLDLGILESVYYVAVAYVPDANQLLDVGCIARDKPASPEGGSIWRRLLERMRPR